jgi:hypothetical protein
MPFSLNALKSEGWKNTLTRHCACDASGTMSVQTKNQLELAAIASIGFAVVVVAVLSAIGGH